MAFWGGEGENQGEQGEQENNERNENQNENQNENNEQEQQNQGENEKDNEANEEKEEEGDGDQNQDENKDEENAQEEQKEAQNDDQAEAEDQEAQISFFKCVALTIEPNIMDVEAMLENGEIDEDEAAELENSYVTEMTSDLNTQESIVFFTYGYGDEDENRDVYMTGINDWIAASSGYDETCNALDEDDVEQIFSKVPSFLGSSVEAYSDHSWYSGFNCKADGTGFKPQMFLDESCTTSSRTMNQYYPFRKATESYSMQVESDLTKYMISDASDSISYSQYCDESEFCNKVMEKSVALLTCEAGEAEANNEEAEEEGQDDEKQEDQGDGQQEGQQEGQQQGQGEGQRRKLTSYQLEYDMASKIGDACPSIQTAFSIDQEYDFSVDDLEELITYWSNTKNGGQDSDRRSLVPGANAAWVITVSLLAILCIGSSLVVSRNKCQPPQILKRTSSMDTDDTADSKKEPLVMKRVKRPIVTSDIPHGGSEIEQSFSAIECTLSKKKQKPKKKVSEKNDKRKTKTNQFRQFLKKSVSSISVE